MIKTFIDRPLLSIVISVAIVIVGLISLLTLPVEKYPDIAPPTISVRAYYPGASADAILKSVVVPLEEQINGVENMIYMTSKASNNGTAELAIYFKQGTNADMATVNVQNRVAQAAGVLPAEVMRIGVTTAKEQMGTLRILSLVSPNGTYDNTFLSNYFLNTVRPELLRIQGVGDVRVFGPAYALRIWLNPDIMAQYKLVPSDITYVLNEQNLEAPIGSLGEMSDNVFQYSLSYTGRKTSVEEFENIIINTLPSGEELKLKDIARVELGSQDYMFNNSVNGKRAVMSMVSQTAGSNATEINIEIDAKLIEMEKLLPKDTKFVTLENTNLFLFASIKEVVITLVLAILLVLLVVYFFLQDFRATLIPTISMLVSLVGTFAFMTVAGYSINLLTLFALVLVIGTVVDNSIVVVEAVQSRFDSGYKSPYKATLDAMGGLVSALFTTTLVFMVIFIPVSFVGGTSEVFYRMFGLTMAVAVGISFITSLTLSPALCAIMLKPNPEDGEGSKFAQRVRTAYNVSHQAMLKKYTSIVLVFIRKKWLVWTTIILTVVLLAFLMKTTKTGFIPDEDTGMFYMDVSTSPGYSMKMTDKEVDKVIEQLLEIPTVATVGKVTGWGIVSGSGPNVATVFVNLVPWDEREGEENSINAAIDELYARTADMKSVKIFAMAPGMIPGYGNGGGFEFSVQNKGNNSLADFSAVTLTYLDKLMERPEIGAAFSSYDINYPQYLVDIDVSQCKRMGVSPAQVLSEVGSYLGGSYISNYNKYSKVYRVTMQADPEYRLDEKSFEKIFIRSGDEMLPASQFIDISKMYGPTSINRFNLFQSIGVNGMYATGYSSGDAIKAIKEVAESELPMGYGIDFSGITREESKGGDRTTMVFAICLLFVYLVLVGLYESLFIPFAVILSIPFGLMGSFLFAKLLGIENNIYLQVGLIMLIGLLAKTAILLTEYASQCRNAGMSIKQSAFFAAKVRLRPILMTSFTMVFGMIPMVFASGVGANGSRTIGVGTVGGMLVGTLGLLFIVPALFVVFQALQEKFNPVEFTESDDPLIVAELECIKKNKAAKENA